ncbi:hypothetical protein LTR95_003624 [Oleoguttula sp. CCFEE 5521]
MVVREDGSKWACQSCLKGHRVSGCTHTDRELVLVPKKGRPTTQCQHCRQERKRRSAHVKCDCGESDKPHHSKEKCIHLREAEEQANRARSGNDDYFSEDQEGHLAAVAEEQGCCCHHGGQCSCAILKREDSHDGMSPHGKPAVQKPRLDSHKSESSLTVFSNGHHKPVHRKNFAAHECGMPYKIPMARAHTVEHAVARAARRSVDNLSLNASKPCPARSAQSSRRNSARRMSKSEQASPKLTAATYSDVAGSGTSDFTAFDFAGYMPSQYPEGEISRTSDSMFPPLEPLSSMSDYTFDPWSAFPSADGQPVPNNNPFGVWPTSAPDLAQPALTAASSGTQSEIDEVPMMEDFEPGMPSIQEDDGTFDFDGLPTNSPSMNRRSLPANFFGNADLDLPDTSNEWQESVGPANSTAETSKAVDGIMALEGAWQIPAFADNTIVTPDSGDDAFTTYTSGRETARSVGSVNTPNDDLMRSLFPEMDFTSTVNTQSVTITEATKSSAFLSQLSSADAPNSFDAFPDADDFTSQPWTDGSINVPNDPFTLSYAFDQDFSSQDYSPSWTQ